MAFAAIQTISNILLMLPYGTKHTFHIRPFWEVSQALKLINAHNDVYTFLLSYHLRKIKKILHALGTFLLFQVNLNLDKRPFYF